MGASAEFRVSGADRLIADLTAGAEKVTPLLQVAVDGVAVELRTATQRNAHGRPGPHAVTSDYISSWRSGPFDESDRDRGPGEEIAAASVYSDQAQAHRLEFGWTGTDSLGRHVEAPPYAHLGPAIDAVKPLYRQAMDAVQDTAVDW